MEDLCPICHDTLDDQSQSENDIVKLQCNHKYHYDCIFIVYKNSITTNKFKLIRNCPYCREDGGFLPLKLGMLPIKFIHNEYNDLKEYNKTGDKNLIKKYLIEGKCSAILKTGINKGMQCSKKKNNDNDYCKKHLYHYKE